MLVIRQDQLDSLEQPAVGQFVAELATHCRAFSPQLCSTLDDDQLYLAIRGGLTRAEAHGLTLRGPVRLYVDMMLLFGSGFDRDPQHIWAQDILRRRELDQMTRAERLHAATAGYLRRVDGRHNIYTLKAFEELAARLAAGLDVNACGFETTMLRLFAGIHPHKAIESGREQLQDLIRSGAQIGCERYGFQTARSWALVGVLMFSFGQHFDEDPLYPWIARTLTRRNPAEPDKVAEKLERRARIWLNAVLRNAN